MMQDTVTNHEVAKNKAELCTQIATQLDHLPNEILTIILSNINLQDLLFLRAVNSRWQAVIESFCQLKQSLFLCQNIDHTSCIESLWLNQKDFTVITYRKLNNESIIFLCRLFSSLQSLAIQDFRFTFFHDPEALFTLLNQWSTLKTLALDIRIPKWDSAELCDNINSMTSLRHLALGSRIDLTVSQLASTLGRLQRFAIESHRDHSAALHHLGHSCTHLWFRGFRITDSQLRHSLHINPSLFSALTHLRLHAERFDGTTFALLCEHTINLQCLDIEFYLSIDLSPTVFRTLSRLAQLIELKLCCVNLNLATLAQQGQLRPLNSVRRLSLTWIIRSGDDEDTFWRIISALFPNVEKLKFFYNPSFSTAACTHLSSLAHLVELELDNFNMDLTTGQVSFQPIPTVRVVRLLRIPGGVSNYASFCRIISAMFPNVEKLECTFNSFPTFSPAVLAHLSSLTHLDELQIGWFTIDLTETSKVPIHPIPSVRVLRLSFRYSLETEYFGPSFCRIFSTMFPGLRELYFSVGRTMTDIEPHLYSFPHLRKHQISYSQLSII